MKRYLSLLWLLLLLSTMLLPAAAAETVRIVDGAGILSDSEENGLDVQARAIADTYQVDAIILTVETLNGTSPQDYADDFAISGDYLEDNVVFLLAMNERQWYISTGGSCIYALTDYGIQHLGEDCTEYFSLGDYYGGFDCFLRKLPTYLDAYLDGDPIDGNADYSGDYYPGEREEIIYYESGPNYFISIGIGLVAAAVVVLIMRSSMNTKRPQRAASVYLKEGSYHLHTHRDMFLYSNVSKTRKPQSNSNSRPGGGSSVHRSSGGVRRGGGGGGF